MILNITNGKSGIGSIAAHAEGRMRKLRRGQSNLEPSEMREFWRLILAVLLTAILPLSVNGQTNSPTSAGPPANRYLLLVETSHSMKPRKDAVLKTVRELLSSRMGGDFRAGDTL